MSAMEKLLRLPIVDYVVEGYIDSILENPIVRATNAVIVEALFKKALQGLILDVALIAGVEIVGSRIYGLPNGVGALSLLTHRGLIKTIEPCLKYTGEELRNLIGQVGLPLIAGGLLVCTTAALLRYAGHNDVTAPKLIAIWLTGAIASLAASVPLIGAIELYY